MDDVPGVQKISDPDAPDACPFCKTDVQAIPGAMLGHATGGPELHAEPWQQIGTCQKCGAHLVRIPGDPWAGTAPQ